MTTRNNRAGNSIHFIDEAESSDNVSQQTTTNDIKPTKDEDAESESGEDSLLNQYKGNIFDAVNDNQEINEQSIKLTFTDAIPQVCSVFH